MFCVNDTVMYENYEVCRIVDVRTERFQKKAVLYYVLKPVYDQTSTIYSPVESSRDKLRKVLSLEEIYQLIQLMPDAETQWEENEQLRKEQHSAILRRGDHQELIKLLKTLYAKRQEKAESGKKFHAIDERTMKEAEHILHGEFAHVLKLEPNQVAPFITGELKRIQRDKAVAAAGSAF